MRNFFLATSLLLASCASVGDILAETPDESVISEKSLAEVSSCLQLKYGIAPIIGPNGVQSIVLRNQQMVPVMVLSMSSISTGGTKLDVRFGNSLTKTGNWRSCV